MKKIIFDLDGTIIDCSHRLYNLFNKLTSQNVLSFENYWTLKRCRYSNQWILKNYFSYSESDIKNFQTGWMGLIESEEYLSNDLLVTGIEREILELSVRFDLYIATNRQNETSAIAQLLKFNLKSFFKDIIVTKQTTSKDELLQKRIFDFNNMDCFIGDTGEDILAAKRLCIRSIGVTWGFRDEALLKLYVPDKILTRPSQLRMLLV